MTTSELIGELKRIRAIADDALNRMEQPCPACKGMGTGVVVGLDGKLTPLLQRCQTCSGKGKVSQ